MTIHTVYPQTPLVDVMGGAARHEIRLHEHGVVALVDVMPRLVPEGQTADVAIPQAARTSYGQGTKSVTEDTGLIRFLKRHRHTTPYEMVEFKFHCVMPVFIARQWVRHRTACLAGSVKLQFDLPGGVGRRGNQLYPLAIRDVYERFQPTQNVTQPHKQANSFRRRDRVQAMMLRRVNEKTGAVEHTKVVDVWESGVKDVWRVSFGNSVVIASADHLFLTSVGWRKLSEAVSLHAKDVCPVNDGVLFSWVGPGIGTAVTPAFNSVDPDTELWKPCPFGWGEYYEVSDQGRVRRIAGGRGSSRGRCKTLTVSDGRAVVSLNRPGTSETRLVHRLVAAAFLGECPAGCEVCHEDGNSLNNLADNLRYGTPASNSADRVRDMATTGLRRNYIVPTVTYAGREMTYDLEVSGPWHNFSADGFIVHNSINEYSARYSEVPERFFRPPAGSIRKQSAANRQGRGDEAVDEASEADFQAYLDRAEGLYADYQKSLAAGVSREIARIGLPLSAYTEWYWKIDLHNLLHFLGLRLDSHAQEEMRDYAGSLLTLIEPVVPEAVRAFRDYQLNAITLTALEIEAIRNETYAIASDNKREIAEWQVKQALLFPRPKILRPSSAPGAAPSASPG